MSIFQSGDTHIDSSAFVAKTAIIRGAVSIGPRAVIMFGAVMRAELDRITIGAMTNIQDNVVLHADAGIPCTLGQRVTVGHAAVVHGAEVGDDCMIGIGALALNRSVIGEGAWLAAGSVLPEGKALPPWTLGIGTPARPVRDLTAEEIERQQDGVTEYIRFAEKYRSLGDHGAPQE